MRHTTVCIFGEVLLDCFPDGRRIISGAPFNVAWHLSAFGETPYLCSAVGEDPEGLRIRDAMADWGMDLRGLKTDPEHPTGQARVQAGEPSYEVPPECAFDHVPRPPNLHCELLYHSTLALRGADSAAALAAIKAAGPNQVFLDCNLRSPWWSPEQLRSLLAGAHWAKLNRAEFGLITGAPDDQDERDLEARATAFRTLHGLTGLIVTLGNAGALAVTTTQAPLRVSPLTRSNLVDPVGAVDAFAAILLLGLRQLWPLPTTLERAQQFACRIAGQPDATALDAGLYEPFIDQWGLAPQEIPPLRAPVSAPTPVAAPAPPKRRGRPRRV